MIGIISTFEQEFYAITTDRKGISHDKIGGQLFYVGKIQHQPFVIAASGPGKVAAAATTQQMIDRYEPEFIVLIGIINKVVPFLKNHDLVLANAVFQSDVKSELFGRTPEDLEAATRTYNPDVNVSRQLSNVYDKIGSRRTLNRKLVFGTLLSGDSIDEDPIKQRTLIRQHGVVAIDQEAGSLAQVCEKNGIPYAIARIISGDHNLADHETAFADHLEASETYLKIIELLHSEIAPAETH